MLYALVYTFGTIPRRVFRLELKVLTAGTLLSPIVIVDAEPSKPAHLACKDKRKDEHRCTSFDNIGNAYCNADDCQNNEDSC